jgi:hypothetical protein
MGFNYNLMASKAAFTLFKKDHKKKSVEEQENLWDSVGFDKQMEYESLVLAAKDLRWVKASTKKIEKMTALNLYQLEA